MTRSIVLLFACLCCIHGIAAQPKTYSDYSRSSGFTLDSLDARSPQVIDNLETLARVWGYAKYHHPTFCDSMYNVDFELFELLPKIAHADKATRNRVLYEWVKGLGAYRSDKPMYDEGLAGMQLYSTVDLDWTADASRLGQDLSALLLDLRYAERARENHYIHSGTMLEGWGWQPVLHQEADYKNILKFDSGYNLLALFRFWNIVEYYAPNMPKTEKPWGTVLAEYIPRMGVWRDMPTFQRDYMSLVHDLYDGHAFFIVHDYYFGMQTVPIWTQPTAEGLIVRNPGTIEGLRPGDRITGIDGQSLDERMKEIRRYTAYSNEAGYRQAVITYSLRSRKDSCRLTYFRDGKSDTLRAATIPAGAHFWLIDPARIEQGTYRLLNDSVGYIYGGTFTRDMYQDAMTLLRDTKAIVIDWRTYPQDMQPMSGFVAEYLIEKPTPFARFSYPTLAIPGTYYFQPDDLLGKGLINEAPVLQDNPDAYKGRIVVLADESTQSAGEFSVMALQARPGTIVVGSQTAGANGNMVFIPLTGGLATAYSSIGCYYPDGYDMQCKGVKIDVEVRPTAEGIKAGRDELLEKALEIIRTDKL